MRLTREERNDLFGVDEEQKNNKEKENDWEYWNPDDEDDWTESDWVK